MTIQRATDRLWSGLSTDPKPDFFAPGILMLETDTGVWWITQEDRTWTPCYPTVAQHQAVSTRVTQAEIEHQVLQGVVTALTTDLAETKAALRQAESAIVELKRRGPA